MTKTIKDAQLAYNIKLDVPENTLLSEYLETGYPTLNNLLKEEFDRHCTTIKGQTYVPMSIIRRTLK